MILRETQREILIERAFFVSWGYVISGLEKTRRLVKVTSEFPRLSRASGGSRS